MRRLDVHLVIDLQLGFVPSEREPVIAAAARLAAKARDRGDLVMLVEYKGNGPTYPSIRKAIERPYDEKLPPTAVVNKNSDDGSHEIRAALHDIGVNPLSFSLSGCNTPWCVLATARGLASYYPDVSVKVIMKACGDFSTASFDHPEAGEAEMARVMAGHTKNLTLA